MLKITHIILIVILFIICIALLIDFLGDNAKIDYEILGNSTNINQTIENLTGDNVSYNNGEGESYQATIHNNFVLVKHRVLTH